MVTKPHQYDKAKDVIMNSIQDDGKSEEKVLCLYVAIYICLIATITQDVIANASSKGKVN